MSVENHNFQVNLRGVISILSNNLYSGPAVFIRELLQNSIDAIHARSLAQPLAEQGVIEFSLVETRGESPTLIAQDNGIGLTEVEVHQFLATIGESSKRDHLGAAREDFIGQFGIGLLSCFMVADEIVMITRSAKENSPAVEWRGRANGTYSVRPLTTQGATGTQVFLRCKPGAEEFYRRDKIRKLLAHYGGMLTTPVFFTAGTLPRIQINAAPPPWRSEIPPERADLMSFGQQLLGASFFDAIPLHSDTGDVSGVAYVLTEAPSPSARQRHRLYLKNMLVTEEAQDLLPEWAFFVRCILNANRLRPTASREGFYADEKLERTRHELGNVLRAWLLRTAKNEPERFARFLAIHHLAMKSIALHDDEFYRLVINMLPFETSHGFMTLPQYRAKESSISYASSVDEFRQIQSVVRAQNRCVINAGYTFDQQLLERLPEFFPETTIDRLNVVALSDTFKELTLDERDRCFDLLQLADAALQKSRCTADIKRFQPADLVALYNISERGALQRSAEQVPDATETPWGGLLSNALGKSTEPYARLVFNFNNPLVQRLVGITDQQLLRRLIEMIYVHALLAGHHPLAPNEVGMLNNGLLQLIDLAAGNAALKASSSNSPGEGQ